METIGERIKRLRGFLGMTQEEFASRIGSARNTIAGYEIGKREPSSQAIALICNVFNVNPSWLKSGSGEMIIEKDDSLDAMINKYHLSHNDEILIKAYISLNQESRNAIIKFVRKVSLDIDDEKESESDLHADLQREIDAQKKAEERSTGSDSTSA